jgi:hypothetical protein
MTPSSSHDVVLRLLDGRSDRREILLEGGQPLEPFAVGSRGAWCVDGGHVADAHVMLAFNGSILYVRAHRGEKALLNDIPLDGRWREASMPGELRFGSARMSIGRRAGPEDATQIPADIEDDASTCIAVRVGRHPAGKGTPREDEATCFDVDRLLAALVLSTSDESTLPTVEVDPAVAASGSRTSPAATSGLRSRGARSAEGR